MYFCIPSFDDVLYISCLVQSAYFSRLFAWFNDPSKPNEDFKFISYYESLVILLEVIQTTLLGTARLSARIYRLL